MADDFDVSGSCEAMLGQFRLTKALVATLTDQPTLLLNNVCESCGVQGRIPTGNARGLPVMITDGPSAAASLARMLFRP